MAPPQGPLREGFIVFAALALYVLSKGDNIEMGGEKHGAEATHAAEAAKPAVETSSAPASAVSAVK